MNVKIINDNTDFFNTPIVWDCFRGSYTKLMPTVPHLLECILTVSLENNTPKMALLFKMYDTDGFQEETRMVCGCECYSNRYPVKEINDETLLKYFDKFWDDYIFNKDSKYRQNE